MQMRKGPFEADLRGVQFLLFPIHTGNHYFLGVVNFAAKSCLIWDSLSGYDVYHKRTWVNMHVYMKVQFNIDVSEWSFVVVQDAARQPNTHACGVYVCATMKAYALQLDPRACMVGDTMLSFRKRVLSELCVHIEQFFHPCPRCMGLNGQFSRENRANTDLRCHCVVPIRAIIDID
jgi:Ulp1 family protease